MLRVTVPWYYHDAEGIEFLVGELPRLFPDCCERIILPHATHEGRTVSAVRVGKSRRPNRSAVLITGNVHARELGGAEFCAYLAYNLCEAYRLNDGLLCGARSFSAAEIRSLIEGLDLIIVPCVNPDGRNWSLAGAHEGNAEKALWRGNRNFWFGYPPSEARACNGVDLNRNQDFLWDYPVHFASGANVDASTNPCGSNGNKYRGSERGSEPETKNLVWLMDTYPLIYAYLDIHCAYGAIVHPWGDEQLQTDTPDMNFRNSAYDGLRDPRTDTYREYMPAQDLQAFQRLGRAFNGALAGVRGVSYQMMPSVELGAYTNNYGGRVYLPTSGANDDYAYSRYFSNPAKGRILAFTVEYGQPIDWARSDAQIVLGFQPSMAIEMPTIIEELIAGTIGFCTEARSSLPSAWSWLNAALVAALVAIIVIIVTMCSPS